MKSQKLQWDDTQDPLKTVHRVGDFDGSLVVFDGLNILLVTNHYRPSLERMEGIKESPAEDKIRLQAQQLLLQFNSRLLIYRHKLDFPINTP